jgi:hypothetical protein
VRTAGRCVPGVQPGEAQRSGGTIDQKRCDKDDQYGHVPRLQQRVIDPNRTFSRVCNPSRL